MKILKKIDCVIMAQHCIRLWVDQSVGCNIMEVGDWIREVPRGSECEVQVRNEIREILMESEGGM